MTLVLDSGGLSALVSERARLAELRRRGLWPPVVPTVVLTESLTGDHRRDFHANRILRTCEVQPINEQTARLAAALRTATMRAEEISATDALVVAVAAEIRGDSTVLTSDPTDLLDLSAQTEVPVTIIGV